MPDFNVIADVSGLLKLVIDAGLAQINPGANPPVSMLDDLHAPIVVDQPKVTLFLFEIIEDPSACNRPRVHKQAAAGITETKPAMALLLKYLVTAWSGDRVTEQKILGRVLQLFYDSPIIVAPPNPNLANLSDTGEVLKVTLAPLTLEERTRVWHAVQMPYKLSLSYEVRVVNLDVVTTRTIPPVKTRNLNYFVPEATR